MNENSTVSHKLYQHGISMTPNENELVDSIEHLKNIKRLPLLIKNAYSIAYLIVTASTLHSLHYLSKHKIIKIVNFSSHFQNLHKSVSCNNSIKNKTSSLKQSKFLQPNSYCTEKHLYPLNTCTCGPAKKQTNQTKKMLQLSALEI